MLNDEQLLGELGKIDLKIACIPVTTRWFYIRPLAFPTLILSNYPANEPTVAYTDAIAGVLNDFGPATVAPINGFGLGAIVGLMGQQVPLPESIGDFWDIDSSSLLSLKIDR